MGIEDVGTEEGGAKTPGGEEGEETEEGQGREDPGEEVVEESQEVTQVALLLKPLR